MKATKKSARDIRIDHEVCKGCHLCVDQCPENVLEISRTRNAKGYLMPAAVRVPDCIACLACEMICPDLAIWVEVVENEK